MLQISDQCCYKVLREPLFDDLGDMLLFLEYFCTFSLLNLIFTETYPILSVLASFFTNGIITCVGGDTEVIFFLTVCLFGIQIIAHLYHKAPETEIKSITGISEMKSANISIAEQNHKAEGKTR